jgi:hypothetical protein
VLNKKVKQQKHTHKDRIRHQHINLAIMEETSSNNGKRNLMLLYNNEIRMTIIEKVSENNMRIEK